MIDQKAREIVAESHSDIQKDAALSGAYDRTPSFRAARLGIIEGLEMAARWHDEQVEHWRRKALEASDDALQCRKYYGHMRAHEQAATAIRALIEEQKV